MYAHEGRWQLNYVQFLESQIQRRPFHASNLALLLSTLLYDVIHTPRNRCIVCANYFCFFGNAKWLQLHMSHFLYVSLANAPCTRAEIQTSREPPLLNSTSFKFCSVSVLGRHDLLVNGLHTLFKRLRASSSIHGSENVSDPVPLHARQHGR